MNINLLNEILDTDITYSVHKYENDGYESTFMIKEKDVSDERFEEFKKGFSHILYWADFTMEKKGEKYILNPDNPEDEEYKKSPMAYLTKVFIKGKKITVTPKFWNEFKKLLTLEKDRLVIKEAGLRELAKWKTYQILFLDRKLKLDKEIDVSDINKNKDLTDEQKKLLIQQRKDEQESQQQILSADIQFYVTPIGGSRSFSIEPTGEFLKVLGIIKNIVSKFVTEHKPEAIIFHASIDEPSRVRLYKQFANIIEKNSYTRIPLNELERLNSNGGGYHLDGGLFAFIRSDLVGKYAPSITQLRFPFMDESIEIIRNILETIKFKNIYPITSSYFNIYNPETYDVLFSKLNMDDNFHKLIHEHYYDKYPKLLNRGQFVVVIPETRFNSIKLMKSWLEVEKGANMTSEIWNKIKKDGIVFRKRSGKIEYWKDGILQKETMI